MKGEITYFTDRGALHKALNMFIDDYIISNLQIIYSFFGMIIVYFISYNFMKRN